MINPSLFFKKKLGLVSLTALMFITCSNQGFAMKRPAEGALEGEDPTKRGKNTTSSEANIFPQSQELSLTDIHESARQGCAQAQYDLGVMYLNGIAGVIKNEAVGVKLITLAANQDYAPAQYDLGWMNLKGRAGLAMNEQEGVRLITLAANQEYAQAQYDLGGMYLKGRAGLAMNEQEGARLMTLAANKGFAEAQLQLGVLYLNGHGVQKNPVEALRWSIKSRHPMAKKVILAHLLGRLPNAEDENKSFKDLLDEIVAHLDTLVYTHQLKMEENNPEGFNVFAIPQLYKKYEIIEEIEGELFSYIHCLKGGCLMSGFSASDELRNSLTQQATPHFLSIDDIEGITYITIGERNVPVSQKLLTNLNKASEADSTLNSIAQLYKTGYETTLADLMMKQLIAQQTTDPSIQAEFKKHAQIVSENEKRANEKIDAIEKQRVCLKEATEKIHSLIRLGGHQRTREFLDDERYSFLK